MKGCKFQMIPALDFMQSCCTAGSIKDIQRGTKLWTMAVHTHWHAGWPQHGPWTTEAMLYKAPTWQKIIQNWCIGIAVEVSSHLRFKKKIITKVLYAKENILYWTRASWNRIKMKVQPFSYLEINGLLLNATLAQNQNKLPMYTTMP